MMKLTCEASARLLLGACCFPWISSMYGGHKQLQTNFDFAGIAPTILEIFILGSHLRHLHKPLVLVLS